MSVDMFLKVESESGAVEGESVDESHAKEIEIISWSWGMSQEGSTHSGKGGGSGKVAVQDVTFVKYIDKSTPLFMKLCCNGDHIKEALLTLRKGGGAKPVEYLKIMFVGAMVSNISTGGAASGGSDRLTETVTLNFSEFHVHYLEQEENQTGGTVTPTQWNIAKNAEAKARKF